MALIDLVDVYLCTLLLASAHVSFPAMLSEEYGAQLDIMVVWGTQSAPRFQLLRL